MNIIKRQYRDVRSGTDSLFHIPLQSPGNQFSVIPPRLRRFAAPKGSVDWDRPDTKREWADFGLDVSIL